MLTSKGITLVELMITVAIIAIIAGAAVPAYVSHVQKSRRQEAIAALHRVQIMVEKTIDSNDPHLIPSSVDLSDINSELEFYGINYSKDSEDAYTITATALVSGPQNDDVNCTIISLSNLDDKPTPLNCINH